MRSEVKYRGERTCIYAPEKSSVVMLAGTAISHAAVVSFLEIEGGLDMT